MFGLAHPVAFVDLETTGTRAARDRITEVGIVRVDTDTRCAITEWSSLIDPEVRIPAAIQSLTGITDAMVRNAPTFSTVARDLFARLADCVFVAHNARFDLSFLKHAFARSGLEFSPRVLCTVRLARRLYPTAAGHNLDALIERHHLAIDQRHRALGDARAIHAFVEMLYREWPVSVVDTAAKRILRMPSLPPQLPPDTLGRLPDGPGVYLFYGDNPLPLYIGKSIHLRERVASHFAGDWRSETDLRLSQEIRRVEYEETAGELGALIREAMLIKTRLPAHNRALRRKSACSRCETTAPRCSSGLQCSAARSLKVATGRSDHGPPPAGSCANSRASIASAGACSGWSDAARDPASRGNSSTAPAPASVTNRPMRMRDGCRRPSPVTRFRAGRSTAVAWCARRPQAERASTSM